MFCMSCGTSLPDQARFCFHCGTQVSAAAGPATPNSAASPTIQQQPSPLSPQTIPVAQAVYPGPPPPAPAAPQSAGPFVLAGGRPTAAFNKLAGQVFHALDGAVAPQKTGGLEVQKLIYYRTVSGLSVPPYYGEYVLPCYARVIPIDLIPNQPAQSPVISWAGWHQFLLQKLLCEPQQTYLGLVRLFTAFGMPVWFIAPDFPAAADPVAVRKEQQFKTEIYTLAQRSLAGGGGYTGGGMLSALFGGGSSSAGGGNKMSAAAAHAMLQLATQGSTSIVNASLPAGGGFVLPFTGS